MIQQELNLSAASEKYFAGAIVFNVNVKRILCNIKDVTGP